jgi:hypothetical protein
MRAGTRALALTAICGALWAWLNSGWSHRPPANTTRRIRADATSPVFGFYAERPTLVTIEGRACSIRFPDKCWGPEGRVGSHPQFGLGKTLMQVNWHGGEISYASRGAYRAVVACTNVDCRDFIQSQRVAVGRRFISCSGAHPHNVYFWSNAIREPGQFAPAGDFADARGEFSFSIYPDDAEALEVCASHWHSWFVPTP